MRVSTFIFSAASGSLAAAAPSPDFEQRYRRADLEPSAGNTVRAAKTFSLGEVENLDYKGGDAPMELLRAYSKFVNTLPPWLADVVQTNPDLHRKFKSFLKGMAYGVRGEGCSQTNKM